MTPKLTYRISTRDELTKCAKSCVKKMKNCYSETAKHGKQRKSDKLRRTTLGPFWYIEFY
jgi:hypothetical protein